jgi:hypothetical protein
MDMIFFKCEIKLRLSIKIALQCNDTVNESGAIVNKTMTHLVSVEYLINFDFETIITIS